MARFQSRPPASLYVAGAVRHGLHRVLQLSDPALWSLARHERRADWDACRRALRCGSIAASCSSIAAASNRARTKVRGGSLFTTGGFQDTTVIAGRDLLSRVPQSKGPFSCDQWGSIIIAGAGCRTKNWYGKRCLTQRLRYCTSKDITAFRVSGVRLIKLHVATWHAGPHFVYDECLFVNLENRDTNRRDFHAVPLPVECRYRL
jgi:hypothetical protein